jgi:two-component system chemotaxis response regulator CheY
MSDRTHILVVDDAATVRLFYRQILEGAGYAVEEAVNGYEGLEKALSQSFALFVVDVNMPKMDGYSLLRKIRRDPALCHVPAIMISTEAQQSDAAKAYESGANLYIVKPVRAEELERMVGLLVGRGLPS